MNRHYSQFIIHLALAGMLSPNLVQADWLMLEGEDKPWSVNVGTRVWVNEWETNNFAVEGFTTSTGNITIKSNSNRQTTSRDFEPTPIPFASVRYGRFFISGSYYSATDFTFDSIQQSQTNELIRAETGIVRNSSTTSVFSGNSQGERSEWDVALGYLLLKNLALTVGYKTINMDFKSTGRNSVQTDVPFYANGLTSYYELSRGSADNTIQGPTVGLSASVPLDYGIGLYGSYSYGFLTWDFGSSSTSQAFFSNGTPIPQARATSSGKIRNMDVDYHIAELGLSYTPNLGSFIGAYPVTSATIFVGYRFQRFSGDVPASADFGNLRINGASDTTQGFVSGVNIAF